MALPARSSSPREAAVPRPPARLVADIGGTNGRFALVRDGRIGDRREYRNAEFKDLPSLLARYFADVGIAGDTIEAACLAVAAPIGEDGDAAFTNAPWKVSARGLEKALKVPRVTLINDFAAQAYGIEQLGAKDVVSLVGTPDAASTRSPRVVLGPGTGLGCAALVPSIAKDGSSVAVTSEGGHMGFAVSNAEDLKVFNVAYAKYGRTSWERVCCGSGLALIHTALWPDDALKGVADGDPSEVVRQAHADPASHGAASVRQFSGMLGSFAGDLALVFRGTGGVYLTGGVLVHLGESFDTAAFLERFVDKGRYREWLQALGVHRILADDVPLRGCARYLDHTQPDAGS